MSSHASSAVAQHQIMETIPQLEQQQAQQTNSNHQQQAHQQQHHQQQHHQQQHHQQAQVQQAMMAALMASGFNVNVNSAQAAAQVQAQVQAQAQAASQMAMQNMQLPVGGQSVPVQSVSTSSMQQSTGGGSAPVNPFAIVNNVNYISAPQPSPVSNASIQHHHQGQEQVTAVSVPAGAGSSQKGQVVVQQQQHQNCAVPANVPSQPFNVNVNNNAMAAAAAQVVAAHSAAAAQQQASANTNTRNNIVQHAGGVPSVVGVNIKNWKLSQLEAHAQLLRDTNQTIPQAVALLLADARRKEEKRTAKRVANRKSACTSRARKKALVEEMTKVNAILKRQAMILALLPDLVIAIQADGEITFCSEQVERVLRHNNEHLVGANINQILVPKSQLKLKQLVEQIVTAEQQASTTSNVEEQELPPSPQPNTNNNGKQIIIQPSNQVPTIAVAANADNSLSGSAQSGVVSANGVAVVSEQSFPLRVVKLEAENREQPEGENSDLSTSNGGSKNTTAAAVAVAIAAPGKKQSQTSSDEYTSSDTKGLRMANEALSRNVRWHNEKMQSCKAPRAKSHTDDVNGAFVTANNADARLSSLEHIHLENTTMNNNNNATMGASYEDQSLSTSSNDSLLAGVEEKKKRGTNKRRRANGESSDESGYRESNDESQSSREDTSSDTETSRNDKDRPKPLAPTCNVCLIRDDLTTIWCEVTSSIRTRSLKEEDESNPFSDTISSAVMTTTTSLESSEEKGTESVPSQPSGADEIKELLLCLRPIRDGEEKVDESLRFATVPTSSTSLPIEHDVVVSENNAMTGNTPAPSSELTPNTSSGSGNSAFNTNDSAGSTHSVNSPVAKMTEQMKMRPPKKRRIREQPQAVVVPLMTGSSDKTMSPPKICSPESNAKKENLLSTTAREQSVVESLMLMSHNC